MKNELGFQQDGARLQKTFAVRPYLDEDQNIELSDEDLATLIS